MSSNFTYFCFIVLSIGEESNQEIFAKRLRTHTVNKKEVKEGEIKKKKKDYTVIVYALIKSTFKNITYGHDKQTTKYAYTHK